MTFESFFFHPIKDTHTHRVMWAQTEHHPDYFKDLAQKRFPISSTVRSRKRTVSVAVFCSQSLVMMLRLVVSACRVSAWTLALSMKYHITTLLLTCAYRMQITVNCWWLPQLEVFSQEYEGSLKQVLKIQKYHWSNSVNDIKYLHSKN